MECLDDNTVNAYIERKLPETVRLRVAAHLDHCEVCLTITCAAAQSNEREAASDTESGIAATAGDPATAGTALVRAQVIGRYALIAMIGRGGMGAVYVAHDPKLDREIALKIVRSERFAQHDVRARLSREARAMAKVKHPHVVAVYDAGELDDGVFIAMELIEGETLTRWQAAPGRGWREIILMYVAAGHGLAAAHGAGVVHRDFKPENVLVDRAGRAAVTDFGIAAEPIAMGSSPQNVARAYDRGTFGPLTQTGMLLGTPRYMSPEQFRGQTVDARTDQFSFAVALFEALYGRAPFDGVTVEELRDAVTAGKLRERPTSTEVPARLHRALVRGLAVRPADRYPSMTSLLDAVITAASPARRGVPLAVAGAVVLGALGTIAVLRREPPPAIPAPAAAIVAPTPPSEPRRLAIFVQPFTNHTGDARLDDILDVAVADVLYRSTRFDPAAGVELTVVAKTLGGKTTEVDQLAQKLIEQDPRPVITAHGSIARDGTRDGTRDGAGFLLTLDAQEAGHARFAGTERAATLDDVVATAAKLSGRLRTALGDPPPAGSIDHVLSRSVEAVHAYMQGQQRVVAGDAAGAVAFYQAALVADPELVDARSALGLTRYNLGDNAGAVAELERAMRGIDRMAERPRLMLLGDYYNALGKYSEAIAAYEQMLARWPRDLRAEINITASALDGADWPLALQLARRAALDFTDLDVIRANLVMAELGNTRLDEAARDGAAMLAEVPRPTGAGFGFVAMTAALTGRPDDAQAIYDKLAKLEPVVADEGRADLAFYEGRLDDAERLLQQQIDPALARKAAGDVTTQLLQLARVRLRRGDRAGARKAALAAMGTGVARPDYMAASLALETGYTDGVADKIATWTVHLVADWRPYGKLLAGDLARAHQRPKDAIAAYREAAPLGATWLARARLGHAYLAAGAPADAARELAWCLEHRGEGALFLPPSLSYIADVELDLARSRDALGDAAGALAAYRAFVAHAPAPQHDPWSEQAHRRITALAR